MNSQNHPQEGTVNPLPTPLPLHRDQKTTKKFNEAPEYCISKVTQAKDAVDPRNLRYEEFIRDLLREKQRTEKNYLEFKRIEAEVAKLKNWGYAIAAATSLSLLRSLFH